jgi:outer membrane protein TolC
MQRVLLRRAHPRWLALLGLLGLLAMLAPDHAQAGEPPAAGRQGELSLPQLLSEVQQRSPETEARRADIDAARERPQAARALDDPMLMIELWQMPLSGAHVPLMFTLRQPITWPGKLAARAAVVAHERPRALAELRRSEQDLRLTATRGYYDYRLAVRSQEVLRAARALASAFVAAVDVRYRVGRAELAELLSAQESLATLDNVLLDAERERELAVAAINVLRSQPVDAPLGLPTTVPPQRSLPALQDLLARATTQRPELAALEHELAQAGARIAAISKERAPDLQISAGYMANLHAGGVSEHNITVGVQSSIPSFSLSRIAAQQREAVASRHSLIAQRRKLEQEIAGQVRAAFLRAETAQRHMRFHAQTLLPLSERALRAAQAGYQSGRVPLSLLLDAARRSTEHQLDFERYQAEWAQRIAELEAACGGPLPALQPAVSELGATP